MEMEVLPLNRLLGSFRHEESRFIFLTCDTMISQRKSHELSVMNDIP